jgi:hypothetical protein
MWLVVGVKLNALSPLRAYGVKKYAPLRIGYQCLWIRMRD